MTPQEIYTIRTCLGIVNIEDIPDNITFLEFINRPHITSAQRTTLINTLAHKIMHDKDETILFLTSELDIVNQKIEALIFRLEQDKCKDVLEFYEYKDLKEYVRS